MPNNETFFQHVRQFDEGQSSFATKGGMTIAMQFKEGEALIGIARCSDKDVFCKATGRKVAQLRVDVMPARLPLPCKNLSRVEKVNFLRGITEAFLHV